MRCSHRKTRGTWFSQFVAVLISVFALQAGPAYGTHLFTPDETNDIKEIVRDYIINNPEVIRDAIDILNERQAANSDEQTRRIILSWGEELFKDPATPVGGNPGGDVTIVEFFDYQCGFCKRVFPSIKELLASDGNIRFAFKEFPILGPNSVFASEAALAAWQQGSESYARFHDAMMASKGGLNEDKVLRIASESGLDIDRLKLDMKDPNIEKMIGANLGLANALNINGTPAFVIGDTVVPGAVDIATLRSLVERARETGFNKLF